MPAHLITHPETPGYYHIWVTDNTHEEQIQFFRNIERDDIFRVVLTFEMDDKEFQDYMKSIFTDQIEGWFLGIFCRIDDYNSPQQWIDGFSDWKMEKARKQREWWLQQYRTETKGQMNLF